MSLSCCICKQGNVQLYKDSLSNLIFCGTTCQSAFFIQGQTKRGRDDDDELEQFQEALNLFKAAALDTAVQNELQRRLYHRIKMALSSGNLSILSIAKDNGLLNFSNTDMMEEQELYLYMIENIESFKFCLSHGLGAKEIDKLDLLNISLDPEMYDRMGDDTIDFKLIQLLVKAGADVNRRSKQYTDSNYTPLFFATLISEKFSVPNVDVLKYLIDNGANITIGLIIAIFKALNLDAPKDETDWPEFLETNNVITNLKYLFSRLPPDFDLLQRESIFSKLTLEPLRFLFLNEFLLLRERRGLSRDVAIIIVAREMRNILNRPNIPENRGKSHLLTLARFLRVPQQIVDQWKPLSKAKLSSYISSLCAIGGVWDGQKFRDHRNFLRAELINTAERFRRDMAWTFDIQTEGKTLDQLVTEVDQILN